MITGDTIDNSVVQNCEVLDSRIVNSEILGEIKIGNTFYRSFDLEKKLQLLDKLIAIHLPEELI